jgi:two-component system phosphate regulon sensor histidine kinase PhoR
MWVFLAVFSTGLLFYSLARQRRLTRIARELANAMEERAPIVISEDTLLWKESQMDRVVHAYRKLRDEADQASRSETHHLQQVETTLASIREAVFILDPFNRIVLSNDSAVTFFGQDTPLKGQRIENILRHSQILAFIEQLRTGAEMRFQEFEFPRRRDVLWFEVSGNLLRSKLPESEQPTLLLLVLHDISRLKNLERMRRDFVANVSHELRTPLTIIKGFTETLVEDHTALSPEARERFLLKIQSNVDRLYLLVEDLLSLSRLESSPDQINLRPTRLSALLQEIAENFQKKVEAEGRTLNLEFKAPRDAVAIDAPKIIQVVENLIENSLRYAGPETTITLRTEAIEFKGLIRCTVEDNGVGLPEKELTSIFQRFYRVEKGRSRERGGTGLGLSIAKHIVQLHKGEIWAESRPGEGLKIHFTLPAA